MPILSCMRVHAREIVRPRNTCRNGGDVAPEAGMARRSRGTVVPILVCLLVLLVAPRPASAQNRKLDRALNTFVGSGTSEDIPVIVTAAPGGRSAIVAKLGSNGPAKTVEYPELNAVGARLGASEIRSLALDASVASIAFDSPVSGHASGDGSDTPVMPETLRAIVGVPDGLTGRGVGVAVIDSGIAAIPELSSRIVVQVDFRGGNTRVSGADDGCGHGTHIASTIASGGLDSSSADKGIAPGVRLIALRVLDADCVGRTSDVISALTFAATYREQLGIDVINLSLGHPVYESVATDPLVRAVERAVRAGIVVVVSAGNYGVNPETDLPGYGGIPSPANAPSALTVGATKTRATVIRSDDVVASYSSRGPTWIDGFAKPDVVAPGHRIVAPVSTISSLYTKNPAWHVGALGRSVRMSGTSMAAGVTSGVAALLVEASRGIRQKWRPATLNPYVFKAILEYTATPI